MLHTMGAMLDVKLVNDLLREGLLKEDQAEEIRAALRKQNRDVVSLLVEQGILTEEELADYIAQHYGFPRVDPLAIEPDEKLLNLLPVEFLRKNKVYPFERKGRTLKVAMANPLNLSVIDDIEFITGSEVQPYVATPSSIQQAIDQFFESDLDIQELLDTLSAEFAETVEETEVTETVDELAQTAEQAPVVRLVNSLILDAVRKGASDIHLEPQEKAFRVRYRIDGVLYEMMQPPLRLKEAITSRIKIMAKLDIAERRLPQDGRIRMRLHNRNIDLRVSTVPTVWGEKIVMRILDKTNLTFDLAKLGFEEESLDLVMDALRRPYGMILVTGPTGSGKTTTLYSSLSILNRPEVNILTVEDPVEYEFPGINQVQVKEEIGLDFARALRAFLRQDPDIIMVGEIRDFETAAIAVRAAITGHLVLSTLHTNDAPSTPARLIDMGVEPFLVASSLTLVIAQRLVRKVCPHCKVETTLHPEILEELNLSAEDVEDVTIYRGQGCFQCNNTGYKGRIGIYEVMAITPRIRDLILHKATPDEIRAAAIEEGMITLRESALYKLFDGLTTAEEVIRVTKEV